VVSLIHPPHPACLPACPANQQVVGLGHEVYVYKIFIDGTMMRSFYMHGGGTSTLKEVGSQRVCVCVCGVWMCVCVCGVWMCVCVCVCVGVC
jgi:hypothetical protein